jgi:cell division protein FtsB
MKITSQITTQDILEYFGTLIIILTGIEPAAKAAAIVMPNWLSFTLAVLVMTLAALQKQYQRKLEREAAALPSPGQRLQIADQSQEIAELRSQIRELSERLAPRPVEPIAEVRTD